MRTKCNSRDEEGVAHFGGKNSRSQHLLEVAFRYVRAYFFARSTPQLVPVKSKHIHDKCVVDKRELDI